MIAAATGSRNENVSYCARMYAANALLTRFLCHSVVSDLIVEATESKDAIEEAHAAVENALETSRAAPAPAPANSFDGDLFGFDAPAPAPMPAPAAHEPLQAPTQSYSSAYAEEEVPAPVNAPLRGPTQSYASSYGEEEEHHQQPMGVPSMQSNQSEDYGMAPLPGPAPGGAYEQYNAPASSPKHQRVVSEAGFDSESIMGGIPTPLPMEAAEPPNYHGQNEGGPTPTNEDISELKRKAKDAEDLANDAEESRRQVMAQVDELRKVSDAAEAVARQNASSPPDKKTRKGFMGRGKKKDVVCLMCCVILTNELTTE
jgi:hypothetical protein